MTKLMSARKIIERIRLMSPLGEVIAIMPPSPQYGDMSISWEKLERSWSVSFPADYRAFMATYGAGTIEDYLEILEPEPWDGQEGVDGMSSETRNARERMEGESVKVAFSESSPSFLTAWGVDASGDVLCWDASGSVPDAWPVLVRNRGTHEWRRYECGMVEFLRRTLKGELDSNPLGDAALWRKHSARFLNRVEEERLLGQGIEPWE